MKNNIIRVLVLSAIFAACALFSFRSDAGEIPSIQLSQSQSLFSIMSPPDSIEGYNRVMFEFNDFVMVWVLRPLGKGFSFIIPKTGREHIDMAIVNLEFFIRGVSCLLEGEFKGAWVETQRFFINLTLGVVGIFDVAEDWFELQAYDEDFGQAFASWGIGPGSYFVIPILGPSTVRDAIGEIFFIAFHPITWIPVPGLGAFVFINRMSLRVKSYMSLRDPAFDKYASLKNLWYLQRTMKINNLDRPICE